MAYLRMAMLGRPTKCSQCGAAVDPLALSCPFCRTTTPAGVAAHQHAQAQAHAHAQWTAQASWNQGVVAQHRLESAAKQSLGFSIAALLVCCAPLGIVGFVQGLRARSMAAALRVPVPGTATIGLVLSCVSTVVSVVAITVTLISAEHDKAETAQRIAALEKQLGTAAERPTLDRATACAIAEIHARRSGHDGHEGYTLQHFDCVGALQMTSASTAELHDFRFGWSTSRYELNACMARGGKWYVKDIRKGACP